MSREPDRPASPPRALAALAPLIRLVVFVPWRAGLILFLLVAMGVLEGAGLVLLVPLLDAIGLDVQSGSVGRLASFTAAAFERLGLTPTLPLVLGVFLGLNLVLSLLRRMLAILSASLEQEVVRSIVARLYAAIVRMDWLVFSRRRASDFVVALTTSAGRAGVVASQMLSLASSVVLIAVYVGVALRVSVPMTFIVLACGIAIMLLMRRRAAVATRIGARAHDAMEELQAAVSDDLAGMKTIRSVAGEARSLSRLVGLAGLVSQAHLATARHYANGTFLMNFGSMVLLSVLVLVAVDGFELPASGLLLLLFLFSRVVPRLSGLLQQVHVLASFLPSVSSVSELEAVCASNAEPRPIGQAPLPLRHAVRFEAVTFRYAPERRPVLSDFTVEIQRGTTVALLGTSGSGKTTMADLLMGLLRPDAGRVLVDGVPLTRDRIGGWRQSVAYVAQETFLFHDTIRANLQWAAPHATEDDMHTALTLAAADFVAALPNGLDTIAGDRGLRLSGGERQRIALARAVLRRPSLLILDEATSALDTENESRVLGAIRGLHGALTILIITHRPSATVVADAVYVLEQGRIVESTIA